MPRARRHLDSVDSSRPNGMLAQRANRSLDFPSPLSSHSLSLGVSCCSLSQINAASHPFPPFALSHLRFTDSSISPIRPLTRHSYGRFDELMKLSYCGLPGGVLRRLDFGGNKVFEGVGKEPRRHSHRGLGRIRCENMSNLLVTMT